MGMKYARYGINNNSTENGDAECVPRIIFNSGK